MKTKIDYVTGNTGKSLMKMAIPLLISMMLMMAYNLVDSLWIGNLLGEIGYAALTNSTPVILIFSAIAMGASNGISIIISQAIGAKNKDKRDSLIATTLIMGGAFSTIVIVLTELFMKRLLILLNTPQEIIQMAYEYLAIYLAGYIFVYMYMQFTAIFRCFGDPMFQVKGMLISAIMNAVIDPIFILWMGLSGAALASVLSQLLCLVFAFYYDKKKKYFKLNWKAFSKYEIIPLLQNAIPSAIQASMPAISTTFMTALISKYGITTIAAYGIMGKLEIFLFYPAMAMNMALTTIAGQCAGAARFDRVKDYTKAAVLLGGVFMAVLSAIVIFFAGNLSGIFVQGADIAEIVSGFFRISSVGYVMYMLTSCIQGELSGTGHPGISMLIMFLYYVVIRIPFAYILNSVIGLQGIWIAILVSHLAAAAISILLCFLSRRKVSCKQMEIAA